MEKEGIMGVKKSGDRINLKKEMKKEWEGYEDELSFGEEI